jgi:hypothetical protein
MSVKQISVFLENRPGALLGLTRVLAEKNVDMRAFSLAETSEFGIARIIVNDIDATAAVLSAEGFVHSITPVVAVAISNTPGGLNKALTALSEASVNVEYMYAFIGGKKDSAYMIFRVADDEKASEVLRAAGIQLAEQEEIVNL